MVVLNTDNATIIGRNMNVRKLLEIKVRQHGDKPFVISVDRKMNEEILTYNQFDEKTNCFANWLLSRGIKKGDFILVHLPNSSGFLIALHACMKIGAVMIPSIIFDVADDLEYKINFAEAKMVVTDGYYHPLFEGIRNNCPSVKDIVIYRSSDKIPGTHAWDDILVNSSPKLAPVDIDPLDAAQMLFTSGTTARPKGVILTHANFLYIGEVCARSFAIGPHDRYLLVLPLFHVNAQCISYFPCLTAGASIVVCEQFSASKFSDLLRTYDCTICSLVSATVRMILAQPPHPLDGESNMWRCPYAIAISDEEWDSFEARFNTKLIDLYGLTETLGPCTIMPIWGEHRRGSVGWPNFGMEVKIVDENRVEVPVGEGGEIAIKGEPGISLFREYYKNPEATANDMVNSWFFSGDFGRIDEDGYVYFLDRKKDVIQRAAENISAPEVERVVNEHPSVQESCVIAVPDPVRDEAVLAVVVFKEGESATAEELTDFCRARMAKFKVPEFWRFWENELPKTSIGKIRKNIVRAEIRES
ncbi:MAG: AMP-binding protein [Deltaproteobacteria bacterium]|nr:AMP-binding protein [Candidatus Anaeroferrophillacea bacterium]